MIDLKTKYSWLQVLFCYQNFQSSENIYLRSCQDQGMGFSGEMNCMEIVFIISILLWFNFFTEGYNIYKKAEDQYLALAQS